MTCTVAAHYRHKQRRLVVWGICALIGSAIAESALSDENAFDGAYIGKRARTNGSGPACPAEDDVSVTIRDGRYKRPPQATERGGARQHDQGKGPLCAAYS
jgi:hypothetical protein